MKPDEFRLELQAEFKADPLLLLFTGIPASGKSTSTNCWETTTP